MSCNCQVLYPVGAALKSGGRNSCRVKWRSQGKISSWKPWHLRKRLGQVRSITHKPIGMEVEHPCSDTWVAMGSVLCPHSIHWVSSAMPLAKHLLPIPQLPGASQKNTHMRTLNVCTQTVCHLPVLFAYIPKSVNPATRSQSVMSPWTTASCFF